MKEIVGPSVRLKVLPFDGVKRTESECDPTFSFFDKVRDPLPLVIFAVPTFVDPL